MDAEDETWIMPGSQSGPVGEGSSYVEAASPSDVGSRLRACARQRPMRSLLRKMIPGVREIRRHALLGRIFGQPLFDPDLWHLGRNSVAWAVSIGLFMAWAPVPFQMFLAAGAAVLARCNLPVAVAMVWVSNPVTVAPLFFAAHKLGAWMLDRPPRRFSNRAVAALAVRGARQGVGAATARVLRDGLGLGHPRADHDPGRLARARHGVMARPPHPAAAP